MVKNVILKKLDLTITDPENKTFAFLESMEIYISAEGEQEVLLASKYDIPENVGSQLQMDPSGNKMDPYIKKESYDLRTVVKVKEIPGQDVSVKADMVFQVTADTF